MAGPRIDGQPAEYSRQVDSDTNRYAVHVRLMHRILFINLKFNTMRNVILIVLIMFSTNLISQKFDVPDGFKWTDKNEYLLMTGSKSEAISVCLNVYDFYSVIKSDLIINEKSKVPVFTHFRSDKKNHVYVLYAIEYRDGYDVVIRDIRDRDTYFFTIDDHDGHEYNLTYRKQ